MARYRKVDPRMWRADAKVRVLSNDAKLLWCYLLTGPETTSLPGVIPLTLESLCGYFNWSVPRFEELFEELTSKGMALADWDAGLVFLPNALPHNPPANPNVIKGWCTPWDEAPECDLKTQIKESLRNTLDTIRPGYGELFTQTVSETVCEREPLYPVPVPVPDPVPDQVLTPSTSTPDLPMDLGPTWAEALAREWMSQLQYYERHPDEIDKHLPRWTVELERVHRIDKHPVEDVERLVRWVYEDDTGDRSKDQWPGWKWNCQSPAKLRQRQRSTDRKYFDVIWEQMERAGGRHKQHDICTDPEDLRWFVDFDGNPLPGEEWRFGKEHKDG